MLNGNHNGSSSQSVPIPYPVPANLRTHRKFPRFIAITIFCFSIFIFYTGTEALARRQREPKTPIDKFLSVGAHVWGLRSSSIPICLGFLRTKLETGKEREFQADGKINFRAGEHALSANTSVHFQFNSFLRLDDFSGNVKFGSAEVTLNTLSDDINAIRLISKTGDKESTFRLPRPGAMYLAEREEGQFTLRFADQTTPTSGTLSQIIGGLNMHFEELAPEQISKCEDEVTNLNPERTAQLFDVREFLEHYQTNGPFADFLNILK